MKRYQESKVGMIYLVDTTLTEATQEVKDAMTGIAPKITLLNGKVVTIKDNIAVQVSDRKGTAVEKKKRRGTMQGRTLYISGKGASYAYDTDNLVLLQAVEVTESALTALPSVVVAGKCKNIHDALVPHAADLVAYDISTLTLSDQLQSVDDYTSYINMPRTTYEQKKQATKNIAVLITDCDGIFEGTDRSVRGIKTQFPEFYTKYFNDREIYNIGGRMLSVRGKALTTDGLPLHGVVFQFGASATVHSTQKGNFQVKHLEPGLYVVKCSCIGYEDLEITIAVRADERTEMEVVMKLLEVVA